MSLVYVSGQFFGSFDNAYRFGYDSSSSLDDLNSGSFGGSSLASIRDPRQNRGKYYYYYCLKYCLD